MGQNSPVSPLPPCELALEDTITVWDFVVQLRSRGFPVLLTFSAIDFSLALHPFAKAAATTPRIALRWTEAVRALGWKQQEGRGSCGPGRLYLHVLQPTATSHANHAAPLTLLLVWRQNKEDAVIGGDCEIDRNVRGSEIDPRPNIADRDGACGIHRVQGKRGSELPVGVCVDDKCRNASLRKQWVTIAESARALPSRGDVPRAGSQLLRAEMQQWAATTYVWQWLGPQLQITSFAWGNRGQAPGGVRRTGTRHHCPVGTKCEVLV